MEAAERAPGDSPWLLAIPVLAALAAHLGGLGNGFTNWDDPSYLLHNPLTVDPLRDGLSGLLLTESIGYAIPLTILAYAGERALFGLDPLGFHAVSLGLHALVVLVAAVLARRLGASAAGAAAAATVFAVHPLVVEPVAWVVGQKDLLAALMLLLALAIRAGRHGERAAATIACGLLVLLSLAAKPNTVAAPLLLCGVDLVRGRSLRRPASLLLYGFTFGLAAAATGLAVWGHGELRAGPAQHFGVASLLEAAWAFLLQARHVLWPHPLEARYFAPTGGLLVAQAVAGLVLALLALAATLAAWRRGRRAVAFGLGAALLAYAPASGVVPLSRGAADSYLYLPLALAVTAGAAALAPVWADRRRTVTAIAVLALVSGALAWQSHRQARIWHSSLALWSSLAERHPDEPRALVRVGDALLFERRPVEALAVYEYVRAQHPSFTAGLIAHGEALLLLGRVAEAERIFAEGARRGAELVFRERYGLFLVAQAQLPPSDPSTAHRALLAVGPRLAERGLGVERIERAAELLEGYGEDALVERLRARAALLRAREAR